MITKNKHYVVYAFCALFVDKLLRSNYIQPILLILSKNMVLPLCVLCVLCGCKVSQDIEWIRTGVPQPLTSGAGNDTEAAWSPDGKQIAFQTDRNGDLDIAVLNLKDKTVKDIVPGPGHACYPCWTADGGIVYSYGYHEKTAAQVVETHSEAGYNLYHWKDGNMRALTSGRWRDYTPWVDHKGNSVYYASTKGYSELGNGSYLARKKLVEGAVDEKLVDFSGFGTKAGAVQPSISPDGKVLLWAQLDGVFQNWRICAASMTNLEAYVYLTPPEMSAYAPRCSPDGCHVAFTGFRRGDSAWGVYIQNLLSGALMRLETGSGNSKSPCWCPDGKELVFENNKCGFYKLYRISVDIGCVSQDSCLAADYQGGGCVEAQLEDVDGKAVLLCASGKRIIGEKQKNNGLLFTQPQGLDFGREPFFVKVTFVPERVQAGDAQIIASGINSGKPPRWQMYIRPNGKAVFSARGPGDRHVAVETKHKVATGVPVDVMGVRDFDGNLRLYMNGVFETQFSGNATQEYGSGTSILFGRAEKGKPFHGKILKFECGRGYPDGVPPPLSRSDLFFDN